MRKLAFALLALLVLPSIALAQVGPPNQVQCNKIATVAVGPVAITQVIAAVAGQNINVCGWHVTNTGAAGTFSLQTGTGTNCGTGTATVVSATNVTSSAPSADHVDYAAWSGGLGNAVCFTPSVATINITLFYSQF